jgi:predicted PurR-regulated permease PerM
MTRARADSVSRVLMWGGLALLGYLVYRIIEPFLIALLWAGVLAVVFHPLYVRFTKSMRPGRAAGLTTLVAMLVVVVPTVLIVSAFVREAIDATNVLQTTLNQGRFPRLDRMWGTLTERIPALQQIDLIGLAVQAVQRAASFAVSQGGAVLRDVATGVLQLLLALFAMFFFLRDSDDLLLTIRRLIPMEEQSREELIARTQDLISAGVTSAGLVAAVQGFLGGVLFAAMGIEAPVFWGVVMGFLCLLPLGAAVVWAPAALFMMASGEVSRGLILAALGFGIVSGADNVLRPMLLSGRAGMNGLVIFLSLLGGLAVFGLVGIVLGPLIVVTALAIITSYADSRRHLTGGPPVASS